MASISLLNPKAEIARAAQALAINITGAMGLQRLMATNLGPKGTTKMLISPAGDIKITKDGNVLLHEMSFSHPTAAMIARASTAQDAATGDGTTSTVVLIGELLKQAELLIAEGLHPRLLTDGIMRAKDKAIKLLQSVCVPVQIERDILLAIAQSSLRTKVDASLADLLANICVDAVLAIRPDGSHLLDLNMIELMDMRQYTTMDTELVDGLVLDHGGRHANMPNYLTNVYILTCNVSLELEKTNVNSSFCYNKAENCEKCVAEEHRFIDLRVAKIIELKRKLCTDNQRGFVVINQKGIDIPSLEALSAAGILALRRAKRANLERLIRACGGDALNSLEDLGEEHLGYAGLVYEEHVGETKYTFVKQCRNPTSVTILIRAPTGHQTNTMRDAIRDGLHAIQNTIEDGLLVPGAGAFELHAFNELVKFKELVMGKAQLGVQLFADSLLIIPKTLAINSGFDVQDTIVKLTTAAKESKKLIGLDLITGESMHPQDERIFDNYCVKKLILNSCSVIACNLLLTDEIMQAGMTSFKKLPIV
ncbi:T-complex protein 1 subunit zeta [Drosophila grimshawi]|uniref:GH21004 n=1 Tax=Drosophila grimshawi TaxID=7222 RepID=B4J534_DROGR|nr:T-complex protein 1 subunit zeta [Drosophila grimshawi]EDW00660.1 GH21004 [Drosophila grimshawi]